LFWVESGRVELKKKLKKCLFEKPKYKYKEDIKQSTEIYPKTVQKLDKS